MPITAFSIWEWIRRLTRSLSWLAHLTHVSQPNRICCRVRKPRLTVSSRWSVLATDRLCLLKRLDPICFSKHFHIISVVAQAAQSRATQCSTFVAASAECRQRATRMSAETYLRRLSDALTGKPPILSTSSSTTPLRLSTVVWPTSVSVVKRGPTHCGCR